MGQNHKKRQYRRNHKKASTNNGKRSNRTHNENHSINTMFSNKSFEEQTTSRSSVSSGTIFQRIIHYNWIILQIVWGIATVIIPVCWVTINNEWDYNIRNAKIIEKPLLSPIAISRWETTLNKVRIRESRDYIIKEVGVPHMSELNYYTTDNTTVEYLKDVYVNPYFTLICIYTQDTLQGFLVVGNRDDAHFKSYRANVELFTDSIEDAGQKCKDIGCYMSFNSCSLTDRLDTNQYYVECCTQHPLKATPPVIIGYGLCNISDSTSYQHTLSVPEELMPDMNPKADSMLKEIYENNEDNDFRKNTRINSYFIFIDDSYDNMLLRDALVNGCRLGIDKDSYNNLCYDYMKRLEEDVRQ